MNALPLAIEGLVSDHARRGRNLTATELHRRLAAVMGDTEAAEVLDTPNAKLDGKTPLEALELGNDKAVKQLLDEAELQAITRHGFTRKEIQTHD